MTDDKLQELAAQAYKQFVNGPERAVVLAALIQAETIKETVERLIRLAKEEK